MNPLLFAQSAEPLSGGAGWVGAGLLGLVLAWLLLKHLPDKDRQLEKLLSSRDDFMTKQMALERAGCDKRHQENLAEQKETREGYREEQRQERAERAAVFAAVMGGHQQTQDGVKELRHRVANLDGNVAVWIALVKQVAGVGVAGPGENGGK